jgi:hypothetical protein
VFGLVGLAGQLGAKATPIFVNGAGAGAAGQERFEGGEVVAGDESSEFLLGLGERVLEFGRELRNGKRSGRVEIKWLAAENEGLGETFLDEGIFDGEGKYAAWAELMEERGESGLKMRLLADIGEATLRRDPEHGVGAAEEDGRRAQELAGSARSALLDGEETEAAEEAILLERGCIHRSVVVDGGEQAVGEEQAEQGVPPGGMVEDDDVGDAGAR